MHVDGNGKALHGRISDGGREEFIVSHQTVILCLKGEGCAGFWRVTCGGRCVKHARVCELTHLYCLWPSHLSGCIRRQRQQVSAPGAHTVLIVAILLQGGPRGCHGVIAVGECAK